MRRDRSAGGRGCRLAATLHAAESAARLGLASGSEMLYGGRTSRDLVLLGEMRALGIPLHLATEDGSLGRRGRVTDELEARLEHWRAAASTRRLRIMPAAHARCSGPWPHAQSCDIECYLSLEEQMACGIGVCLGCAVAAETRRIATCARMSGLSCSEVMAQATAASTSRSEGASNDLESEHAGSSWSASAARDLRRNRVPQSCSDASELLAMARNSIPCYLCAAWEGW